MDGNLQMPFDVSLHRVTVLVCNPTRAGSRERAPIRRDARDPLYDGVPRDVRGGGDYWWIWGFHHHQMTITESTWEIGDERGTGYSLRTVHMTPAFRCIPIIEVSMKRVERVRL